MVSVEMLSGLERRIQVSVPATRVRQQMDARLLKVSRTARIKGFRPGKAPIHVVRKHYGPQVRDEVVSDLIRETFAEALRQEKLLPAGGPRIEPQKTDQQDDLRFPDEYQVKNLAGKTARFQATIRQVEEPRLPEVDATFCEAFGVTEGGITALRAEVRENMERELGQAVHGRLKSQVMEQLLAANPIAVPNALVEAEIRDMQMELLRRMGSRDPRQLPPRESFEQAARRRVALGLILNEVIRQAGIQPDAAQVQSRLDEIVAGFSDPEAARRQYLQNEAATRQLQMSVLEDQAVAWVINVAQVTDQPGTFKEIMNFGADAASEG